ncbi:spinster family MFS transporter [Alteraurantiacibacter aquimixticola]|uniref:MFS transporter n=1 Tax=Alteraurantiacibacter aquimixticola TaxID=2489173 RepID=A0A4T3EZL7_9SPHN|nr:MFS transporter [Alteraurantiacibacter aquimixticola]TIX49372.1 MFS transporter [Alteraurantiacibacter aquimixticola]
MAEAGEEQHSDDDKVPGYSWYALGVLFVVYLVNFVDRQILSILANDIRADLGIDDAQLGFLYGTAFAIFYALFGIPLGRLADGWVRVRLLSLGLTLWSCMTILSGLARNMTTLTIARIGVGVGEASANPCAYSLISDWFPKRIRATALAIYSSGLFVGSGLSLLIGGTIVERWNTTYPEGGLLGLAGWQAAFIMVGLPGLLLAVWVLSLREPKRGVLDGGEAEGNPNAWRDFAGQVVQIVPPFTLVGAARRGGSSLAINLSVAAALAILAFGASLLFGNAQQFWFVAVGYYAVFSWASALHAEDAETFAMTIKAPAFVEIVLIYAAVCYIGYSITYWAAPYAERAFGFSKSELGWLIGAPNALGGFLGVIMGGWLADRLARRFQAGRVLVPAIALLASVPLLLVGYTTASSTLFLVCNFLGQMVTSSALGACAAASLALVKPRMRGTATAVFLLGATLIGLAFGPFIAGLISETTGSLGRGVMFSLVAVVPGMLALWMAVHHYPASLARVAHAPS